MDVDSIQAYYTYVSPADLRPDQQIFQNSFVPIIDVDLNAVIMMYKKTIFQEDDLYEIFVKEEPNYTPETRDFLIHMMAESFYKRHLYQSLETLHQNQVHKMMSAPMKQEVLYYHARSFAFSQVKKARNLLENILGDHPKTHLRFQIANDLKLIF